MLVVVTLLGACASAPGPDSAAAAPIDAGVAAVWSVQDMADAVTAMTDAPPITASDVRATYLGLLAQGDAACPGSDTQLLACTLSGCTAASGIFYAGVSVWSEQTTEPQSWRLAGDFEIVDPDGHRFIGGGASGWQLGVDHLATVELSGTWSYPDATDGWLGTGVSAYWRQTTSVDGDHIAATLEGGLSYAGVSLWTDGWRYDSGGCPQPLGTVDVRDPSGLWFHLDYGDSCGTTADVTLDGAAAGQVELDLGPWVRTLATAGAEP